jgi:thiol-disulfide isomerase/thioredoxin
MLRKLLIISCLLITQQVNAQKHTGSDINFKVVDPAGKSTENKSRSDNPQVIGALLPPFLVVTMPQPAPEKAAKSKKWTTDTPIKLKPPKYITNKDVQYDANLFLMFFNPTCGHCEDMTELLEHHMQYFHKTKIVMIAASNARPYMDVFEKNYNINQYATLIAGTDSLDLIKQLFEYKSLPQFNIYDRDRKLIKVFSGDIPLDSLKPYIQ